MANDICTYTKCKCVYKVCTNIICHLILFLFFFLNERSKYFIDQRSRAQNSYITKHKALQNYSHMLWGYIVIDINKILTIKCYLWLSSSANPCKKIVKEQICSEQTRSKTMIAKYPKKLFKPAVRDNPSYRTI
jgi:hypothetical protein